MFKKLFNLDNTAEGEKTFGTRALNTAKRIGQVVVGVSFVVVGLHQIGQQMSQIGESANYALGRNKKAS